MVPSQSQMGDCEAAGFGWSDASSICNAQFTIPRLCPILSTEAVTIRKSVLSRITRRTEYVHYTGRANPSAREPVIPKNPGFFRSDLLVWSTSLESRRGERAMPECRAGWPAALFRPTLLGVLPLLLAAIWDSPAAVWAQRPRFVSGRSPLETPADDLISQIHDARGKLEVPLRRSRLIRTKQDVFRIAVAAPDIIEIVQFGPREISVIGVGLGSTTLTFWFGDKQQGQVHSYLVTVLRDRAEEERRSREYREFETRLNELFPDSRIILIAIADKLVVKGQARDAKEASQIMAIVREQVGNEQGSGAGAAAGFVQAPSAPPFPDPDEKNELANKVINMLVVPGEMQVMLKVRIAELNRTALRRLGVGFDFQDGRFFFSSILSGRSNIVATFDAGDANLLIEALISNQVGRILAEPVLITLSGHTASFIAGGEFAVPTVVGVGGVEAATTEFRGFGTQLTFTPTVIDKDLIRLEVAPEFSAINQDNSVRGIPGLDTRRVVTTVDLREGQVLGIAGLLLDQNNGTKLRIPWVGDLPLVGAMFASQRLQRDETELIVLVSPEIVHPMEPEEVPLLLPGTDVTEPDDVDFFFHGRIEGRPGVHHRSTLWPVYRDRVRDAYHKARRRDYQRCEDFYFRGPHGFSS